MGYFLIYWIIGIAIVGLNLYEPEVQKTIEGMDRDIALVAITSLTLVWPLYLFVVIWRKLSERS